MSRILCYFNANAKSFIETGSYALSKNASYSAKLQKSKKIVKRVIKIRRQIVIFLKSIKAVINTVNLQISITAKAKQKKLSENKRSKG